MSYCAVCGDEEATYRSFKRQTLCGVCNRKTPAKISREEFDHRYWAGGPGVETVPESTRRDFYEDYLRSSHTFTAYIKATTGTIVSSKTGEAYTFKDKDLPKSEAKFRDDLRALKDLYEGWNA